MNIKKNPKKKKTQKTLGFDPGLQRLGFAVVETEKNKIIPITYGLISTSPKEDFPKRLLTIFNDAKSLIETYKPDLISIETLVFSRNVTTAFPVSNVRGVLILLSALFDIPIVEFSPSKVKLMICGYGKAKKAQVQSAVKILLNLPKKPTPDDVADAIAIAICGANSYLYNSMR